MKKLIVFVMALTTLLAANAQGQKKVQKKADIKQKVSEYAEFKLTSDLVSELTENERQLVKIFIEIGNVMDEIYWDEYFGKDNRAKLADIKDPAIRAFAEIHYGAWDRLDSERPFIPGYGPRPAGCNFYPADMTKKEFDALKDPLKNSEYSVIRRDSKGKLYVLPYHEAYKEELSAYYHHCE